MEGKERKVSGAEEMAALAREVAEKLKAGDILLLYGDLGSGKTTFTQALARIVGVEEAVTSPTFTVVSEYEARGTAGINKLVHVDLYRLGDRAEEDVAVRELWERPQAFPGIVVVEWAERLRQEIPGSIKIYFRHGENKDERRVNCFWGRGVAYFR